MNQLTSTDWQSKTRVIQLNDSAVSHAGLHQQYFAQLYLPSFHNSWSGSKESMAFLAQMFKHFHSPSERMISLSQQYPTDVLHVQL